MTDKRVVIPAPHVASMVEVGDNRILITDSNDTHYEAAAPLNVMREALQHALEQSK